MEIFYDSLNLLGGVTSTSYYKKVYIKLHAKTNSTKFEKYRKPEAFLYLMLTTIATDEQQLRE